MLFFADQGFYIFDGFCELASKRARHRFQPICLSSPTSLAARQLVCPSSAPRAKPVCLAVQRMSSPNPSPAAPPARSVPASPKLHFQALHSSLMSSSLQASILISPVQARSSTHPARHCFQSKTATSPAVWAHVQRASASPLPIEARVQCPSPSPAAPYASTRFQLKCRPIHASKMLSPSHIQISSPESCLHMSV